MSRINSLTRYIYDNTNFRSTRRSTTDSGVPADVGVLSKRDMDSVEFAKKRLDEVLVRINDKSASEEIKKQDSIDLYAELTARNVAIRFDVDKDLNNKLIVKIVKKSTGETMWQYPPKYSLEIQKLSKYMPGLLVEDLV